MTVLTAEETAEFDSTRHADQMATGDYTIRRGRSGHAFASNGFSMVRDLTDREDVEADSIDEADGIVAGRSK